MSEEMSQYLEELKERNPLSSAVSLMRRAIDNPKSKKFAIIGRCVQCVHGVDDEGWRERIRSCDPVACALHPVRPYQSGDDDEGATDAAETTARKELVKATSFDPVAKAAADPHSRRKAINAYCWQCMGGGSHPNVQHMIAGCGIDTCLIHHVRPYQRMAENGSDGDSVTAPLKVA